MALDIKKSERKIYSFTLVGEGGMGKSTLASMFPSPLFLRTEDGLIEGVDCLPLCRTPMEVGEQILKVYDEPTLPYKTLVFDSISRYNEMVEQMVVKMDPKNPKSLNQALGGYGAGHEAVANVMRDFRERIDLIQQKHKINIVFVCHAETETITPPDSEQFTRYSLRVNKKAVSVFTDTVDCVAFVKQPRFVKDGQAVSEAKRILTCYPIANHVSKNRFGITKDLDFTLDKFPFAPLFKGEEK